MRKLIAWFSARRLSLESVRIEPAHALAIVAATILCLVDFSSRVFFPSVLPDARRVRDIAAMKDLPLPRAGLPDIVTAWLPQQTRSAETEVKKVKLLGVFRSKTGWSAIVVLVGATTTSPARMVRIGDTIENWQVETIESRGMTLRRGEETTQEWLFDRS
jgi:hypothetical protein